MENVEFKDIINEIMGEEGLNQEEMAKKLGIKQGHLSDWARGHSKPSYDHLRNICLKLNISGDRLLGIDD